MLNIEWTRGAIMFYSGIAGMGLTLLIAAITVIILRKSKERLTQKLDEEYGKRQK